MKELEVIISPNIDKLQIEKTLETIVNDIPNFPKIEKVREVIEKFNNPKDMIEYLFREGVITTSKDIAEGRITPENIYDHYAAIVMTSGTTGIPKAFRMTLFGDGLLIYEQGKNVLLHKTIRKLEIIHSLFPSLPSFSGETLRNVVEKLYLIDGISFSIFTIPPTLLAQENLPVLVNRLEKLPDFYKPRCVASLTTHGIQLLENLPKNLSDNIQVLIVGGENLPISLANRILEEFENLKLIADVYGASEFGIPLYRFISKENPNPYYEIKSGLMIANNIEERDDGSIIARIYPTKIEPKNYPQIKKSPLGIYPLNHDIGDYAIIKKGYIYSIFRKEDQISLSAAKLNLNEISEIAFSLPGIKDFVVLYTPLSENNLTPRAKIKLGYSELEEPEDKIAREFLQELFSANNPVNYEVNITKSAKLSVEVVPLHKLRDGLPQYVGKTKRLYIIE